MTQVERQNSVIGLENRRSHTADGVAPLCSDENCNAPPTSLATVHTKSDPLLHSEMVNDRFVFFHDGYAEANAYAVVLLRCPLLTSDSPQNRVIESAGEPGHVAESKEVYSQFGGLKAFPSDHTL